MPAFEGWSIALTGLVAGADLSAASNQFKFVKLNAQGKVVAVAAASDDVIGVLYNRPKSGEPAEVRIGQVEVQTDAAVSVGAAIATSADGQAKAIAAAASERHLGYALTGSAAAGERISAWIMPTGAIKA